MGTGEDLEGQGKVQEQYGLFWHFIYTQLKSFLVITGYVTGEH